MSFLAFQSYGLHWGIPTETLQNGAASHHWPCSSWNNGMSFKVMTCLTNKAHPSEPHKSGFQEGNSLMPHLQTSPSRRKGKSFISTMPPVFPTCRAGMAICRNAGHAQPLSLAWQNSSSDSRHSLLAQIPVCSKPFSLLRVDLSQVVPNCGFCFKNVSKL